MRMSQGISRNEMSLGTAAAQGSRREGVLSGTGGWSKPKIFPLPVALLGISPLSLGTRDDRILTAYIILETPSNQLSQT